eukprot:TRINITY_DN676_c0_g1_i1.p1 TRINITY_DN676_c0_g1~~TRINITY_DN676_c0_g1_i1.p1  ORF type:complete len:262 (+),score=68.25 TRINITY_DN676_c0_g1_i1:515-1300(+)
MTNGTIDKKVEVFLSRFLLYYENENVFVSFEKFVKQFQEYCIHNYIKLYSKQQTFWNCLLMLRKWKKSNIVINSPSYLLQGPDISRGPEYSCLLQTIYQKLLANVYSSFIQHLKFEESFSFEEEINKHKVILSLLAICYFYFPYYQRIPIHICYPLIRHWKSLQDEQLNDLLALLYANHGIVPTIWSEYALKVETIETKLPDTFLGLVKLNEIDLPIYVLYKTKLLLEKLDSLSTPIEHQGLKQSFQEIQEQFEELLNSEV